MANINALRGDNQAFAKTNYLLIPSTMQAGEVLAGASSQIQL